MNDLDLIKDKTEYFHESITESGSMQFYYNRATGESHCRVSTVPEKLGGTEQGNKIGQSRYIRLGHIEDDLDMVD